MNEALLLIFQLIVFIFSVIIHEVSHGAMALKLGDTTAKDMGRLTLNPLKHLDLFGSFLLPIMLYFLTNGAFVFGWAKPVPYDPTRLKNPLRSAGLIAAAGPGSNLVVAFVFGMLIRLLDFAGLSIGPLSDLLSFIVFVNILLAIFNLLPLPPLDGSKVLFAVLPYRYYALRAFLQRYGFVLLLLLIFSGLNIIRPFVIGLYKLLVGSGGLF